MTTPRQLKSLYERGENISALLRKERGTAHNTTEIIEIAYDLQTGSYIAALQDSKILDHQKRYTSKLAETIRSACEPTSILEAGVGEATTFSGVLQNLRADIRAFGFDLSWSRVAYGRQWLQSQGLADVTLCTGSLFHIPFADSSVDVVYTSHSIEPNGGREKPILRELYRVTRKVLVLLEPGYELASEEAQRRMESHGYCKNLKGIAESLGYRVLKHELFPFASNPLNPTAITVIKKEDQGMPTSHILACPRFKTPLEEIGGMLFSEEAMMVYPIVAGIPCLRTENGIFASKYKDMIVPRTARSSTPRQSRVDLEDDRV